MATLTQVAIRTRRYTVFTVVILVGLLVLRIIFAVFGYVGYIINSNAPLHADSAFGKLPNIAVNPITYTSSKGSPQFVLNTTNGGFPQEPSLADVYKFSSSGASLLSTDIAQKTARQFGFTGNASKLSDSIYSWQQSQRDFVYNISTGQFRIINQNSYGQIQGDISQANSVGGALSLTQSGITSAAAGILQNLPIGTDFDQKNPTFIYLNVASDNSVTQVSDSTSANAVRITYYRVYSFLQLSATKSLSNDKLYLIGDNPVGGDVSFTLDSDSASLTSGLLDLTFSNWTVDATSFSTYNIKSPQQAWQDVQNNSAYLAYLVKAGGNPYSAYSPLDVAKFQAERIYLAYFDGIRQQNYLEPIYVIQGTAILTDGTSAQFYFYDPAII